MLLRDYFQPNTPQVIATSKRNSLLQPALGQPQQQQLPVDPLNQQEDNQDENVSTADYLAAQLQKMGQKSAPPQLTPGSRVKYADTSQVQPGNFQSFYDMLGLVNQRGQSALASEQAKAQYRQQQELARIASQMGGGGASTSGGSYNNAPVNKYNGPVAKGVQQWSGVTLEVMHELGIPDSYLPAILRRMNQESGGNPNIQNNWDSNAKRGTPSIGLMQTIGPTFNSYAGPYRGLGITNPKANIYAGLKYAGTRYGPSHGGFLGGLLYAMNKPGGY